MFRQHYALAVPLSESHRDEVADVTVFTGKRVLGRLLAAQAVHDRGALRLTAEREVRAPGRESAAPTGLPT